MRDAMKGALRLSIVHACGASRISYGPARLLQDFRRLRETLEDSGRLYETGWEDWSGSRGTYCSSECSSWLDCALQRWMKCQVVRPLRIDIVPLCSPPQTLCSFPLQFIQRFLLLLYYSCITAKKVQRVITYSVYSLSFTYLHSVHDLTSHSISASHFVLVILPWSFRH